MVQDMLYTASTLQYNIIISRNHYFDLGIDIDAKISGKYRLFDPSFSAYR